MSLEPPISQFCRNEIWQKRVLAKWGLNLRSQAHSPRLLLIAPPLLTYCKLEFYLFLLCPPSIFCFYAIRDNGKFRHSATKKLFIRATIKEQGRGGRYTLLGKTVWEEAVSAVSTFLWSLRIRIFPQPAAGFLNSHEVNIGSSNLSALKIAIKILLRKMSLETWIFRPWSIGIKFPSWPNWKLFFYLESFIT